MLAYDDDIGHYLFAVMDWVSCDNEELAKRRRQWSEQKFISVIHPRLNTAKVSAVSPRKRNRRVHGDSPFEETVLSRDERFVDKLSSMSYKEWEDNMHHMQPVRLRRILSCARSRDVSAALLSFLETALNDAEGKFRSVPSLVVCFGTRLYDNQLLQGILRSPDLKDHWPSQLFPLHQLTQMQVEYKYGQTLGSKLFNFAEVARTMQSRECMCHFSTTLRSDKWENHIVTSATDFFNSPDTCRVFPELTTKRELLRGFFDWKNSTKLPKVKEAFQLFRICISYQRFIKQRLHGGTSLDRLTPSTI